MQLAATHIMRVRIIIQSP